MKNIFLILPLLLNPISQSDKFFDFNIDITQDEGIASIEYGTTEKTNAQNNYIEYNNDPNYAVIYEITQKYQTRSYSNPYIDIKMNDYAGTTYLGGNYNNNIDMYYNNDFNIIAITPYIHSSDESAQLTLTAKMQFTYNGQPYWSVINNITINQTNEDLSTLIDRQDWSASVSKYRDYFNMAEEIAGSNKTNLLQITNQNMDGYDIILQEYYDLTLTITLTKGITTYIYGKYQWEEGLQYTQNIITNPNETTQLMHIAGAQIEFTPQQNIAPEIVDIPGLMFTILGMPFSFISQAFNITLFPHTPYEVNISNLFLSFIAIALLLWILKLILGRADLGQWIADNKNSYRRQDNRRTKQEAKAYREEHKK